MSFRATDLIVESVIRDGLTVLRRNPDLLDDIFADLSEAWLAKKYGQKEINKIKEFFCRGKEISIVHAFGQVPANVPCVSIQLLENPEDQSKASLEDFEEDLDVPMTDPVQLAKLVIATNITVFSYDPFSGIAECPDSADLSNVKPGNLFVDASGAQFRILGGILNASGGKQFILDKDLIVRTSTPGQIVSQTNYTQVTRRQITESEHLILGVHTQEPLLTKYLYLVLKFILGSRKVDLVNRGLQEPTYRGSDFTRNLEYPGDQVYNRFLTLSGFVKNNWNSDQFIPVESVDVTVKVPRATASTAEAGLTNQTVQIQDTDFQPKE